MLRRLLRALVPALLAVALTGAPRWVAETREAPHRCECPARAHDCSCPVCGARAVRAAGKPVSLQRAGATLGCRCGSAAARLALAGGEPYLAEAASRPLPVGREATARGAEGAPLEAVRLPEVPPPRA